MGITTSPERERGRESGLKSRQRCTLCAAPTKRVPGMENGSIMSMIAGFLPPSSTPPPSPPPPTSSSRSASTAAAGTHGDNVSAVGGGAAVLPRRRVVHMICFSKDRAFQLDQLLESSTRHLRLAQEEKAGEEGAGTPAVQLRLSVLYLASSATAAAATGAEAGDALSSPRTGRTMQDSYDLVQRRHPGVRFVRERPGEFCDQLCSLVGEGSEEGGTGGTGDGFEGGADDEERFVLFAVDDMFFYRDFELPGALRLLARGESNRCLWCAAICSSV